MVNVITTDSYFNLFNLAVSLVQNKEGIDKGKNIIFCEEKVSLMLERLLCYKMGGSFNTEVYSFGNFLRIRKPDSRLISKEGSAMAVKNILSKVNLTCFKPSRASLSETLAELIMQLKSAKITPSDIKKATESADGVLKNKLNDIGEVFLEYERFIEKKGYVDQSAALSSLPEIILESQEIAHSDVYLVGFSGFTAQMREAVSALIERANSVTAVLCEGENDMAFVNETADCVENLARAANQTVLRKKVYSDYSDAGKIITNRLFNPFYENKGAKQKTQCEIYYSAEYNASKEIEHVGEIIKRAVINGEMRYRDFTVALPNVSDYKEYIRSAFGALDIPYFLDERKKPINHPIVTLILSYIDAYRKNFERKALIAFFKNPFFEEDKNLTDDFENYIIKYNINYSKIKDPFKFTSGEDLASLEELRKRILAPFSRFDVRNMLKILNVEEKVQLFTEKLGAFNEAEESAVNAQVYGAVVKILDEMDDMLSGVSLSIAEYKNVFTGGVNALELSIIPQYNDAVFVGAYKETALAKAECLFAVGLTGEVPSVKADVALLSDGDIETLEKIKILVEPKIRVVNHRIREHLTLALAAFSRRLYLSYPITAIDGSKNMRSEILNELENVFEFLPFPKEDGYVTYSQGVKTFAKECSEFTERLTGDFIKASSFYSAAGGEKLNHLLDSANKEIKQKLSSGSVDIIGDYISPTTIEDYYKCPYRAFLTHKLKLKAREEGKVQAFSVGNLMHEIFRVYAKRMNEVTDKVSSDALFDSIKEKVMEREEYKKYAADSSTKATVNRVLAECKKYCYDTFRSFISCSFKVDKTEAQFGDGKDYPAISLMDGKVKLKGMIDRVDVSDDYYRVLDYKTGTADATDKSLFAGVKLQLYLYAAAVGGKYGENKALAGAYYLPVSDKYEPPKDKIVPLAVGKTLNEQDAISAQDGEFNALGKSAFLPVKKDKSGNVKNACDKDTMQSFVDYALKAAESAVMNMKDGVIVPSPFDNTCEYCEFKSMCSGGGEKRTVGKVSDQTIARAVKENSDATVD